MTRHTVIPDTAVRVGGTCSAERCHHSCVSAIWKGRPRMNGKVALLSVPLLSLARAFVV